MTNSRWLTILSLLLIVGCGDKKGVEKRFLVDVTKPYRYSFIGMRGEKVNTKITGKFSGSIKVGSIGSSSKLTEGNFAIFKDSINWNVGTLNIYQDSTGFIWYVKPDNTTGGKILFSVTEYRN